LRFLHWITAMQEHDIRQQLLASYRQLLAMALGTGTSGNISCRLGAGMLITPTGIAAAQMRSEDLVAMALSGEVTAGQLRPSSEWHMHAAIYAARPDLQAVVHCHSRHATTLACTGRPIPAVHYMIAATGAEQVPLAPYARFGTEELASSVAATLGAGRACLLANHGQIAAAESLPQALRVAEEVEELAAIYCGTLAIGGAVILDAAQMAEVTEAFADYGQQSNTSGEGP
jgi:L-fuculose-phosphate aldolase